MELSQRARVRAGDHDEFGVLFEQHARAVYNHAFRLTGNWSTAEEVVSLTFLEAWRLRGTVRPEGDSLLPWLLGIALNVARNVSRAARRHQAAMSRLPQAPDVPDFADELAATAVVVTANSTPAGPGAKPAQAGVTTAGLLAKIAAAAASQPSPAVRGSDFMYIRSRVAYTVDSISGGHETSTMEKLHERQVWLPVANLCVAGLLIEDGESTLLSPFPVVNGKVDSSPPPPGAPRPNFSCPSEGHLGDATYRLLQSLPTGPAALLSYLKAGRKWTNDDPVTEIGDLIREAIIPPAVAAALYRVAALLPGATLVPDAANAVGRHGIAIVWADHQGRTEWIFDRATLQYIGEMDYDAKTGALTGESAILQRAFTAKAGQQP